MVAGCGVPSAGVAGGRGGCPRPIGGFADDEASTARLMPLGTALRRALPAFAQTGWLGFSRRRATRRPGTMGVVRSVQDG